MSEDSKQLHFELKVAEANTTREDITAKITDLREAVEQTNRRASEFATAERILRDLEREYAVARYEDLRRNAPAGLTWCTICELPRDKADLALLNRSDTNAYELHRMCSGCWARNFNGHGMTLRGAHTNCENWPIVETPHGLKYDPALKRSLGPALDSILNAEMDFTTSTIWSEKALDEFEKKGAIMTDWPALKVTKKEDNQ